MYDACELGLVSWNHSEAVLASIVTGARSIRAFRGLVDFPVELPWVASISVMKVPFLVFCYPLQLQERPVTYSRFLLSGRRLPSCYGVKPSVSLRCIGGGI